MRGRATIAVGACVAGLLALAIVGRAPARPSQPDLSLWAVHEACRQQRAEFREVMTDASHLLSRAVDAELADMPRIMGAYGVPAVVIDEWSAGMQRIGDARQLLLHSLMAFLERGELPEGHTWVHLLQESGIDTIPVATCPEVR